jgi:hypothetical protein
MEKYVYTSILIFSLFILNLYIYLIFEKLRNIYFSSRKNIYSRKVVPYIDDVLSSIDSRYPNEDKVNTIKLMAKNRIKRELIEEKIIYYIEMFSKCTRDSLIRLCEETEIVNEEIKVLKSKDIYKIALACKKLGSFRSKNSIGPILNVLGKGFLDIRYHALLALSKIGDEDALSVAFESIGYSLALSERSLVEIIDDFEGDKISLYKRMINSTNEYISRIFIKSAGNYMDAVLNDEIAKYLTDNDKEKKIAAIKSIGQTGDTRFTDSIIKCLYDNEWEVRAVAARTLGRLGDSNTLNHIAKTLTDREWWVRYNSALSIIELPSGINLIQEVFDGDDRFAKEILIASIENSHIIYEMDLYENSTDIEKRKLSEIVKRHILNKL